MSPQLIPNALSLIASEVILNGDRAQKPPAPEGIIDANPRPLIWVMSTGHDGWWVVDADFSDEGTAHLSISHQAGLPENLSKYAEPWQQRAIFGCVPITPTAMKKVNESCATS